MTTEAFLQDIIEHPDDDGPRLIYADWLEDNGRPQRAEFIRVQIEQARLPAGDDRHAELKRRDDELHAGHAATWMNEVPGAEYVNVYRRGFAEEVCPAYGPPGRQEGQALLQVLPGLMARTPLRSLKLRAHGCARPEGEHSASYLPPRGESALELLAESPLLARLHTIDLSYMTLEGDPGDFNPGLTALAQSPHAAGLTTLGLYNKGPSRQTLEVLGSSTKLPRLCSLDLGANGLRDDHLALLASLPIAGRLKRLALTWNHLISAAGVRGLLDHLRLEDLELELTGFATFGVELLSCNALKSLDRLLLSYSDDPVDWDRPASCTAVRSVADLPELLGDPRLGNLTRLSLEGLGPTRNLLAALAKGELGYRLHSLSLRRGQMTDADLDGVLALLESGNLRELALRDNFLTSRGARRLAQCPGLARLHRLDLSGNNLNEKGRGYLEQSRHRHPFVDMDF